MIFGLNVKSVFLLNTHTSSEMKILGPLAKEGKINQDASVRDSQSTIINAPVDNFIARLLHENKLKVSCCVDSSVFYTFFVEQGYALPLNERLVKQSLGSLRGRQMQSDIIHSGRM